MRSVWLLLFAWPVACGSPPPAEEPPPSRDEVAESAAPAPSEAIGHAGGASCDEAMREHEASQAAETASKETAETVKELLNQGDYLNRCRVPSSASVEICVALMGGETLGVTAVVDPGTQAQADCVAGEVKLLEFPESLALLRASTKFDPAL